MSKLVSRQERLLRLPVVRQRVADLSKTSILRMVKDGEFPAPRRIGKRAVAWVESELNTWIAGRGRSVSAR